MELSHEDNLRLNVLLRQNLHAVRIDESALVVYALTERGEARVPLNPNCREEQYLRGVRELLSTHVLGSPGGYPVFLRRWTRMGQARDESLQRLLLLGEPEAVVAVVHARGLTDELARRAWWAMPTAENARRMLAREAVARGSMGPVLAEFLLEFLPFEEQATDMMESVRLVLQPGLIDEQARMRLWERARSKNTYYVGFLQSMPDDLPEQHDPHPAWPAVQSGLAPLCQAGDPWARVLCRALSGAGQSFLKTAATVLRKPNNQDVVVALFDTLGAYFAELRPPGRGPGDIHTLMTQAEAQLDTLARPALAAMPELRAPLGAMAALSLVGEPLAAPVFARTDAVGSVMRRKLEPITTPLMAQLACLTRPWQEGE